MEAIFIRHGTAEPAGPEGDAGRRLADEGKAEVRATAEALRKLGINLRLVLTSPLVRAVQTAEILGQVHAGAKVMAADILAPAENFKVAAVRGKLESLVAEGVATVAMVGHAPSLDQCVGELIAAAPDAGISLSKAGAACVELPVEDVPTGARLRWIMRANQLASLARMG